MFKERHYYKTSFFNKGPYAGQTRYHLDALMAALHDLKPRFCLEIGTNIGNSAHVFKDYFEQHRPDGHLITCDIKRYKEFSAFDGVDFVQVCPHVSNSSSWHAVTADEMVTPSRGYTSVEENIGLIKDKMKSDKFDFVFVDGDHQWKSVEADMEIALELLADDGYILMDDISEFEHDSARYFEEVVKKDRSLLVWEFDLNWEKKTGGALVWRNNGLHIGTV